MSCIYHNTYKFIQQINSENIEERVLLDYAYKLYSDISESDMDYEFDISNYISLPTCMIERLSPGYGYFETLSEKYKDDAFYAVQCDMYSDDNDEKDKNDEDKNEVCKTCKGSTRVDDERCEDCC